jgi:FkbM family methyltransferase
MTLEHDWDRDSIDYVLTPESVVIELGGYQGRWAKHIAIRNNPQVFVFEPQEWAYLECYKNLMEFPNAHVFNFALGTMSGTFEMSDWGTDGCSFVKPANGKPEGHGKMREIIEFLDEVQIGDIELMLMNIEGYEFTLIPYMLKYGLFDRIRHFICQFHPRDEVDERHYLQIKDTLGQRMLTRFNYGKTLMGWDRL